MTRHRAILPSSLLLVVALAGCKHEYVGANGEKVTVDSAGKNVTVTTSDGKVAYAAGGGVSLPAGFPADVPIYPGANITAAVSAGNAGSQGRAVTFETGDLPRKVADFYKDKLSGWERAAEMTSGAAATLVLRAPDKKRTVTVVATPAGGRTYVTLTVGG
jgi:hypothetical protein